MSMLLSQAVVWWRFAFARSIDRDYRSAEEGKASSSSQLGHSTPHAFEAFFWQFERQIIGYLCRMTNDEQTAFDLSQETFLRAWQHFDTLLSPAKARSWIFRVATNLALNHLQHRAARPMVLLTEQESGKIDPGQHIAEQEVVHQILQQLPPKQRSVLLLFEVYGLSCDEIGTLLHMKLSAVKMTLRRAREHFRNAYLREEGE